MLCKTSPKARHYLIHHLKSSGGMTNVSTTTAPIPTMVSAPSECKAGWRATISAPIPMNMMAAESSMPRR